MKTPQEALRERIKILVDELEQGVQRRFAMTVGVHATTIGEILGKRQNQPSSDLLHKIAVAYPQLRTEWLLIGAGQMLKAPTSDAGAAKKISYNSADLFPKEAPKPEANTGPRETTELYGQIIHTTPGLGEGIGKRSVKRLPGQDLIETVAGYGTEISQLRQELAALKEQMNRSN